MKSAGEASPRSQVTSPQVPANLNRDFVATEKESSDSHSKKICESKVMNPNQTPKPQAVTMKLETQDNKLSGSGAGANSNIKSQDSPSGGKTLKTSDSRSLKTEDNDGNKEKMALQMQSKVVPPPSPVVQQPDRLIVKSSSQPKQNNSQLQPRPKQPRSQPIVTPNIHSRVSTNVSHGTSHSSSITGNPPTGNPPRKATNTRFQGTRNTGGTHCTTQTQQSAAPQVTAQRNNNPARGGRREHQYPVHRQGAQPVVNVANRQEFPNPAVANGSSGYYYSGSQARGGPGKVQASATNNANSGGRNNRGEVQRLQPVVKAQTPLSKQATFYPDHNYKGQYQTTTQVALPYGQNRSSSNKSSITTNLRKPEPKDPQEQKRKDEIFKNCKWNCDCGTPVRFVYDGLKAGKMNLSEIRKHLLNSCTDFASRHPEALRSMRNNKRPSVLLNKSDCSSEPTIEKALQKVSETIQIMYYKWKRFHPDDWKYLIANGIKKNQRKKERGEELERQRLGLPPKKKEPRKTASRLKRLRFEDATSHSIAKEKKRRKTRKELMKAFNNTGYSVEVQLSMNVSGLSTPLVNCIRDKVGADSMIVKELLCASTSALETSKMQRSLEEEVKNRDDDYSERENAWIEIVYTSAPFKMSEMYGWQSWISSKLNQAACDGNSIMSFVQSFRIGLVRPESVNVSIWMEFDRGFENRYIRAWVSRQLPHVVRHPKYGMPVCRVVRQSDNRVHCHKSLSSKAQAELRFLKQDKAEQVSLLIADGLDLNIGRYDKESVHVRCLLNTGGGNSTSSSQLNRRWPMPQKQQQATTAS
mmetsp:Transcript_5601/g.8838  ORF Transcript_5601/g.8838 Transcript_5601/m.8838 type:complete len:810 (-) Transcript_5601:57-2486(-)